VLFPNFQDQIEKDLDAVFLNAGANEFAKKHLFGDINGGKPVELNAVADYEQYQERKIKDDTENISLNGVVVFIKKELWTAHFGYIPEVGEAIKFDKRDYQIEAVTDDMGMLELTLGAARGGGYAG
jgi:hypothetical protein